MSVENRLIKSKLLEQEEVISRGYIDCGKALMVIRDERLYRLEYKSFESYVKERWEFTKSRANQLIEATTIVVNLPLDDRPKNEAQARELAKIPEAKRAEVMAEVKKTAKSEDREVTAKDIKNFAEPKVVETISTDSTEPVYEDMDDDDEEIGGDEPAKPIPLSNQPEALVPKIKAVAQAVTNLKRDVKYLHAQRGGEWIPFQECELELDQLRYKISKAAFAMNCPKCKSKADEKCIVCKGVGFVSEARKSFAENNRE